jgi:hypothetical protein
MSSADLDDDLDRMERRLISSTKRPRKEDEEVESGDP